MLTSDHAAKLTDLPDDQMGDILPMAKKLAQASGAENYNILQVGTTELSRLVMFTALLQSMGETECRHMPHCVWRAVYCREHG